MSRGVSGRIESLGNSFSEGLSSTGKFGNCFTGKFSSIGSGTNWLTYSFMSVSFEKGREYSFTLGKFILIFPFISIKTFSLVKISVARFNVGIHFIF
jgi:hypothetical protein